MREGRAEPCPYGVGGCKREIQGNKREIQRKKGKEGKTGGIGNHRRKLRFLGKA